MAQAGIHAAEAALGHYPAFLAEPPHITVLSYFRIKRQPIRGRLFRIIPYVFIWLFSERKEAIDVGIVIEFVAFPIDVVDVLKGD